MVGSIVGIREKWTFLEFQEKTDTLSLDSFISAQLDHDPIKIRERDGEENGGDRELKDRLGIL